MYISCPSCSTSFSVDGAVIGSGGRSVRCYNCSHTWHQYPVVHQPQAHYVPVQYVSPSQFAVSPQAAPSPVAAPAPEPAPLPEPESEPIPEPEPEPEPLPEPEPIPEEDLPSDEDLDAMLGETDDVEDAGSFAAEPPEDVTEIDEEALEELEDPEPLESFNEPVPDDDFDEDLEPEDIPDPDPLPEAMYDPDDEEEPQGSLIKTLIKVVVILVVVIGLGTGAVFMRGIVVDLIPATNVVFELIGLRVAIPGEGLDVNAGSPKRETIDGKDYIVLRGLVRNVSDVEQPVPQLFVRILDGNKVMIAVKTVIPSKKMLKPNENVKFTTRFIEATIATGRDVDVVYGPFQDEAGAEGGEQEEAAPKKDEPK